MIIRWHLQLGLVVLPKSVTPQRIQQNLEVFGFALDDAELGDAELDAIAGLNRGFRTGPNPDEFHLDVVR